MAFTGPLSGVGGASTTTTHSTFIPELWMPEIKRELDQAFIMKQFVDMVPDQYRTANKIHMPTIGRLRTYQKESEKPVTLQPGASGEFTMTLNYRPESSISVDDILSIQSNYDTLSEHTREAGYALALDLERWLLGYRAYLKDQGQAIQAETSGGAPAPLNQAALLAAKLRMDKANVPPNDRMWVFSPSQHISLLSIPEFTSKDYVSGTPVESGEVGRLYGYPVIVTNSIIKNTIDGVDLNAGVIGAAPDLVPSPGFAKNGGAADVYSPWWPDPTYNGNVNGAGNHTGVDITDSLTENAYTGMLVRKGFMKMWMPQDVKVESERLVLYQADAVVSIIPLVDAKVFREEFCVLIV